MTEMTGGPGTGRFGQRAGAGAAAFSCTACGEVAAVVMAKAAGEPVNGGPHIGMLSESFLGGRDWLVVEHFVGTHTWPVEPATFTAVTAALAADPPDAAVLRRIDWELAPFLCRTCDRVYCWEHWHPVQEFDEMFYDCTRGTCPSGHRQMIDD